MVRVRVCRLRQMCIFLTVAGFAIFRRFRMTASSPRMLMGSFLQHNQTASPARGINPDRL
jgi:hypothetical protein